MVTAHGHPVLCVWRTRHAVLPASRCPAPLVAFGCFRAGPQLPASSRRASLPSYRSWRACAWVMLRRPSWGWCGACLCHSNKLPARHADMNHCHVTGHWPGQCSNEACPYIAIPLTDAGDAHSRPATPGHASRRINPCRVNYEHVLGLPFSIEAASSYQLEPFVCLSHERDHDMSTASSPLRFV
jgi:hypothetical protein